MKIDLDFTGKVVLVTGSTRGIGKATAQLFAEHNATVVLDGRDKRGVSEAVEQLNRGDGRVSGIAADITNGENVKALVDELIKTHGRIDVLINNAGIAATNPIEKISDDEWDRIIDTNLKGTFTVTRAVVPHMKERGSGCIVNVSSAAATHSHPHIGGVHYASAKGGLLTFTKNLSKEVGACGIRVNAVMPGPIRTDMTADILNRNDLSEQLTKGIALRRAGLPEEVASVILFLASNMSSYITGEIIAVNGGLASMLFLDGTGTVGMISAEPFTLLKTKIRTFFEGKAFLRAAASVGRERVVDVFKTMLRARTLEEQMLLFYKEGKIKKICISGIGQEAGPATVATLLEKNDGMIPPYRGHAHVIGKGLPLRLLAAELMGKTAGPLKGRGNLGNFSSPDIGIYPNSDILGNNFPTAVGMGFTANYRKTGGIVVSFFGDGAATRSLLYGSLNLSALWRLPILWVCENNQYSVSVHLSQLTVTSFSEKAKAFGMASRLVDGNDIGLILPEAARLIDYVRRTRKPAFLELKTYRVASHDEFLTIDNWYQDPDERNRWLARDPLSLAEKRLERSELASREDIARMKETVRREVDEAFLWAQNQTDLVPQDLINEMYEH